MITAFVLCVTDSGKEKEIWKRVAAMDYVKEVYIVYGEADLVIKLVAKNLETLDPIVTRIGETEGVCTTSTLIVIDSDEDETRVYDEKTRIY